MLDHTHTHSQCARFILLMFVISLSPQASLPLHGFRGMTRARALELALPAVYRHYTGYSHTLSQITIRGQTLACIAHENSVHLSSATNPKPKGQPCIPMPAQAYLIPAKGRVETLRCLALRTIG